MLTFYATANGDQSVRVSEPTPASQEEQLPDKDNKSTAGSAEHDIEIAGVTNWNRPSGIAFGAATSLYERHPVSGETAGNPLADVRAYHVYFVALLQHIYIYFLSLFVRGQIGFRYCSTPK